MASLGEELLNIVNRLQDLVFNTIGNDSLDLPQIVRCPSRRGTCAAAEDSGESSAAARHSM
jgi:dynamin 1-like protein